MKSLLKCAALAAALCAALPAQAQGQRPPPAGQLSPGAAGVLLDQAQAARMVGGYWRVQWAEDPQNFGIMHVTGVNVADNLLVFDGSYSPDGLTTCPISGSWVYVTRGYYASGGTVQTQEFSNYARIRMSCPGREINAELAVIVGTPPVFAGRAIHTQGNQQQTLQVRIRRFAASF